MVKRSYANHTHLIVTKGMMFISYSILISFTNATRAREITHLIKNTSFNTKKQTIHFLNFQEFNKVMKTFSKKSKIKYIIYFFKYLKFLNIILKIQKIT